MIRQCDDSHRQSGVPRMIRQYGNRHSVVLTVTERQNEYLRFLTAKLSRKMIDYYSELALAIIDRGAPHPLGSLDTGGGAKNQTSASVRPSVFEDLIPVREKSGVSFGNLLLIEISGTDPKFNWEAPPGRCAPHPMAIRLTSKDIQPPRGIAPPYCTGYFCLNQPPLRMLWRYQAGDFYCCRCRNSITPSSLQSAS
jgi:hypothetical protein